jgi:hypothetical protein
VPPVRSRWERLPRLPFAPGYNPAEITPADLAAFNARMRRALGLDPDLPPRA